MFRVYVVDDGVHRYCRSHISVAVRRNQFSYIDIANVILKMCFAAEFESSSVKVFPPSHPQILLYKDAQKANCIAE